MLVLSRSVSKRRNFFFHISRYKTSSEQPFYKKVCFKLCMKKCLQKLWLPHISDFNFIIMNYEFKIGHEEIHEETKSKVFFLIL